MLKAAGASKTLQFQKTARNLCNGLYNSIDRETVDSPRRSSRFYNQNLPKQPVPSVETIMKFYWKSVQPFLNKIELIRTKELIDKFGDENGYLLRNYAVKRAEQHDNWQEDYFVHGSFLNNRRPLMYNNPSILSLKRFANESDRVRYTASVIESLLHIQRQLDDDRIPVDKSRGIELDMSQYRWASATCRVPGFQRDRLHYCHNSKHVVVACNNHFYKVPVYNDRMDVIGQRQLERVLHEISKLSDAETVPVGLITADGRDNCYAAYERLKNYSENLEALSCIHDALLMVCLDTKVLDYNDTNKETVLCHQVLNGGGSRYNSGNRWFGKCIQFIVGNDGTVGFTMEHSLFDGTPRFNAFNYMERYLQEKKFENLPDVDDLEPAKRLTFKLDDKLINFIEDAKVCADNLVNSIEIEVVDFDTFGTDFLKLNRINNVDCFFQMALQYAYYRLYGEPGVQMESVSLRKFSKGRINSIRSCSVESIAFAKSMLDKGTTDDDKLNALRTAIERHKESIDQAVNGSAVDDYLIALQMIGDEKQVKLPRLYKDKSYLISGHVKLISSRMYLNDGFTAIYCPLVEDGYSCAYNLYKDNIRIGMVAMTSCPRTSVAKFRETLTNCLTDMHDLLLRCNKQYLGRL